MPARADAGNAHAAGEVAIGKTHPRAAEAALIELLEMKARLERHAPKRRADRLAFCPQRSRRQPYRAHRSRAASGLRVSAHAKLAASKVATTTANRAIIPIPSPVTAAAATVTAR